MLTIGVDVHLRTSVVCVLDENGKRQGTRTIRGSWRELVEHLRSLGEPFRVCYEASCGYGPIYDALSRIAERVVVAHPGHLRLIFRAKRKSDRVDAEKLATLLYLDQVPPVHVPSADVRAWRGLIEHRRRLVGRRTQAKNGLRTLLRGVGETPPRGASLWTRKGLAWVRELDLDRPEDALRRDMLLADLEHFDQAVARVTQELDRRIARHPGGWLLQTIPGVGPRTAEAFLAYVDDPRRFGRVKNVGSYFGLVPRQDQSGPKNRLGHITKHGPASARSLLVEAAWQCIRRDESTRRFFERIAGPRGERKKIALVATAHRLARTMLAMLRSGSVWEDRATPA